VISIYVGNLTYAVPEADLVELFSEYGQVIRATIVVDRETKRSRGFGFVEMEEPEEGREAVAKLSGEMFQGRPLTINEARPRGSGTGERVYGDGSGGPSDAPESKPKLSQEEVGSLGYSNRLKTRENAVD